MPTNRNSIKTLMCSVGEQSLAGLAAAQQVTGTLGSPSATTTVSNAQLPAPDPAFGGVIKNDALQSKRWWAPRIVPPKGAPNVLLIITDDAGFGTRRVLVSKRGQRHSWQSPAADGGHHVVDQLSR